MLLRVVSRITSFPKKLRATKLRSHARCVDTHQYVFKHCIRSGFVCGTVKIPYVPHTEQRTNPQKSTYTQTQKKKTKSHHRHRTTAATGDVDITLGTERKFEYFWFVNISARQISIVCFCFAKQPFT